MPIPHLAIPIIIGAAVGIVAVAAIHQDKIKQMMDEWTNNPFGEFLDFRIEPQMASSSSGNNKKENGGEEEEEEKNGKSDDQTEHMEASETTLIEHLNASNLKKRTVNGKLSRDDIHNWVLGEEIYSQGTNADNLGGDNIPWSDTSDHESQYTPSNSE